MDHIDNDFAPIRKSNITVKYDNIIKDVKTNHDQMNILKNISLVYGTKMSSSKRKAIESRKRPSEPHLKKKKIKVKSEPFQENKLPCPTSTNGENEIASLPHSVEIESIIKENSPSRIPLFPTKRYSKTSTKRNTTYEYNAPLVTLTEPSNLFVKKLKLDLLTKLSPRSNCGSPAYFSETDETLTKIIDSNLEGAPFDKPITLSGSYSYSYELFQRIFRRECLKYNIQYIKLSLCPLDIENNQRSKESNCEIVVAKMKIRFPNENMKKSFQKIFKEWFNLRQILKSLLNVITMSNRDLEHKYIILFSLTDTRYLKSPLTRLRWKFIKNFLTSINVPALMACSHHIIKNAPLEPTSSENSDNSTIINVPSLKSLPEFISELSTLLCQKDTSTRDVELNDMWNRKILTNLNDKNSALYTEVQKVYNYGEGPLNCVELIIANIINCNDLFSTFHVLDQEFNRNVED